MSAGTLSAYKNEDYARVLMMYNPKKDKIQELLPASRYRYSMKKHKIIYTHQTENERMRLNWIVRNGFIEYISQ